MVKDWSTLQKTGNAAVDMVADQVFYARKFLKPLKSITLSPRAYIIFTDWVKKMNPEVIPGQKFEFDGVDVEKGSSLMIKDCILDYYQALKPEA